MLKYSADFETATWLPNETYVWAWALCNIENVEDIKIGNTLESFMDEIEKTENFDTFEDIKEGENFAFKETEE